MLTHHPVDGWRVRATAGPVPPHLEGLEVAATVPGTVHTDLLDAGLVVDPYVDDGEVALAWMKRTHWRYRTEVALPTPADDERVDLVLAGVDTVATVALGGVVVARPANMHRSYRVDVREAAERAGGVPVPLTVDLASALEHAEAEQARIGFRPGAYPQPLNMVRKMACSFGWDWGPDLQTAGLWQPVTVERWRVARIASVRPLVTVSDDHSTAVVAVHVDLERSGIGSPAGDLTVTVRLGEHGGDGAGRGRRVGRPGRGHRGPAGPVVAAGVRRGHPARPRGDAARRRRHAARHLGASDRPAQRRRRHHARRARHAVHVRRERPAALRQGRQLDPRRPPAHPGHPRPARPPHRPGGRRRAEPAAGLGRRHLRERGLLRAVRRGAA